MMKLGNIFTKFVSGALELGGFYTLSKRGIMRVITIKKVYFALNNVLEIVLPVFYNVVKNNLNDFFEDNKIVFNESDDYNIQLIAMVSFTSDHGWKAENKMISRIDLYKYDDKLLIEMFCRDTIHKLQLLVEEYSIKSIDSFIIKII